MPSLRAATATIASSASLSDAVEVNLKVGPPQNGVRESLVGIIMPSSWTAANLTFQASNDNSTFNDMYAANGAEVLVQASTSRHIAIDPADFAGVAYVKVRSGTSAAAVTQTSARSITLIFRPVS